MNKYQLLLKDKENTVRQLEYNLPYNRHAAFQKDGLYIYGSVGPINEAEARALAQWILEMVGE